MGSRSGPSSKQTCPRGCSSKASRRSSSALLFSSFNFLCVRPRRSENPWQANSDQVQTGNLRVFTSLAKVSRSAWRVRSLQSRYILHSQQLVDRQSHKSLPVSDLCLLFASSSEARSPALRACPRCTPRQLNLTHLNACLAV